MNAWLVLLMLLGAQVGSVVVHAKMARPEWFWYSIGFDISLMVFCWLTDKFIDIDEVLDEDDDG